MIPGLICPLIYSLVLGGVWSACFKKKFSSSLAPAFMVHILLVLLSGLIFKHLSIGVWGGIVIALVAALVLVIKNGKNLNKDSIRKFVTKLWNEGLLLFLVFYVLCFLLNSTKCFIYWDEFSHWGIFLKESLRLDNFYCTSPMEFYHKDYVPAMTLFETIWCKISFRYLEADVYRAMQVFMFSLLMPMLEKISEYSAKRIAELGKGSALKYRAAQLGAMFLVLFVPLLFRTIDGFAFYHTIYCDIAVALIFFWCVYEAYKEPDDKIYQFISLTIAVTVLVLTKMIAMAFLPLIFGVLIVRILLLSKSKMKAIYWALMVPLIGMPVAFWMWFNKFSDKFIVHSGEIQSYDGMSLSQIAEAFGDPAKSSIPYLSVVRESYLKAIFTRNILAFGSYALILILITALFFVMAIFIKDRPEKKKTIAAGIWTILSGIYYAFLMYFMYCTNFEEYEARRLASFERYMNTFIIVALFLLLAVYFESELWKPKKMRTIPVVAVAVIFAGVVAFYPEGVVQVLPGFVTGDQRSMAVFTNGAEVIESNTGDDAAVYIVVRGDNGDYLRHQEYYCGPRTIGGGSIGPVMYDGDIWSEDLTVEEFIEDLEGFDYIYFSEVDDVFTQKYSGAFEDPTLVANGVIYKIVEIDSKVHLEQI